MKKSILLVEDDPFLIDIYVTKLEEAGLEIDIAKDGQAALSFLEQKKPDLLILDIVLPYIDGWELLKKIRQKKQLKDLSVVILSNLGQKQEVKKGLELGVAKYLIKAYYTPTQVVQEIKKILNESK